MSRLQSKNNVVAFFENPSGNSVFHFHPYQQIHWRKYHWSSGFASFNGLKPFSRFVSKDECKLPIVQLTACTCVLYMTRGVHKMFINHLSFFRSKIHLYSMHIVLYYGKHGAKVVEKWTAPLKRLGTSRVNSRNQFRYVTVKYTIIG